MSQSGKFWTVAAVATVGAALALPVAGAPPRAKGPFTGTAVQFDVSPPLRDMAPVPRTKRPDHEVPLRPTPQRNRHFVDGTPDPLRQTEARPDATAAATLAPSLNFEGMSDDDNAATVSFRVVPPDTNGDIGPGHYVQTINSIWAVWNVTRNASNEPTGATLASGFPKAGNSIWSGFGGPCQDNNDGDPVVLYDHLDERWLVSQFSINEGIQCVALSTTGDPTGSYFRWAFLVSPGDNNDYPKLGLMPGAYYLSLRDFPSGDGDFAGFVALNRAAMLTGSPTANFVKFSLPCLANDCPDGVQPPHLEGPAPAAATPGYFTRAWDVEFEGGTQGGDGYRVWRLTPDFATPANSTFVELPYIASAGFDSTMCGAFQRGCIPQPKKGGGERLDPVDELQMFRAQYRHFSGYDTLLLSTTVDSTGGNVAGMRWAELRDSGSGWTLFQEGTYAPGDGENRWMGSVAMNGEGDIALGYSLASGGTYPSVRYTTRQATDAAGTMPGGEIEMVAGAGSQTASSNRWGDYSSMSVDPLDDCTFWYTQEYYANTGSFDFKTRIAAFPGPSCTGGGGCTPTGSEEGNCGDGLDNDCNGFVDCNDSVCSTDLLCAACTLGQPGDPCSSNGDCCSNNCKGKPGAKTCK
jgi:hypothetical protein